MMDYSKLVKQLRDSEDWAAKDGGIPVGLIYRLSQAADAIEELSKQHEAQRQNLIALMNDKPRWIPVTERLPNENDDVLIYGEWTGASGTKYREVWLTDLKSLLHQGYKPIAWMPLPTPPKEETE